MVHNLKTSFGAFRIQYCKVFSMDHPFLETCWIRAVYAAARGSASQGISIALWNSVESLIDYNARMLLSRIRNNSQKPFTIPRPVQILTEPGYQLMHGDQHFSQYVLVGSVFRFIDALQY